MAEITLILDAKKRISLSKLLKFSEVSSVTASLLENGNIILRPMVAIPAQELWLHRNPEALASVKKGLVQKGTIDRGSFSKYAK